MKAVLNRPARMLKLRVGCLKDNKKALFHFLESLGVIDLREIRESKEVAERIEKARRLYDSILKILEKAEVKIIDASLSEYEYSTLSLDMIERDVKKIEEEVFSLEYKSKSLENTLNSLRELERIVSMLPNDVETTWIHFKGKHIASLAVMGKKPLVSEFVSKRTDIRLVFKAESDEEEAAVLVFSSMIYSELIQELPRLGIGYVSEQAMELISRYKIVGDLKANIPKLIGEKTGEINSVREELRKTISKYVDLLGKYLLFLENLVSSTKLNTSSTELRHLVFVEGWIPEKYFNDVFKEINNSSLVMFFEVEKPRRGSDNPPSLMENPRPLRPFELITKLYGVPSYWEIDPTPLVAYSFAFFFALMNNDIGYGLAGIVAVLLVLDKLVENPFGESYRMFKKLLLISNGLSIIFGAMSGAFFGDLLPAVFGISVQPIVEVFTSPIEIIKLSIIIGLIHVNIAHILAVARSLSERRKGDLLNELGLLISQIFGIPYILLIFFNLRVPILNELGRDMLLYLSLLGIVIIIVGNYLNMRGLGLFMWIFQITGILGDVLSYVRLAGVGLATYYMSVIFNTMIKLMWNGLSASIPGAGFYIGLLVSIPFLFLIHLMVLILSILGAFIHSLRLCILEFLPKFYSGDGREYNPLKITLSRRIVVK
ncbi:MAG: V-type ATPase 116kDa subunit family protein [Thermosphaera sp.]